MFVRKKKNRSGSVSIVVVDKSRGRFREVRQFGVAQSHWQTARQNQIASLQNYWLAYYHLRRLTLYDYQRRQTVTR